MNLKNYIFLLFGLLFTVSVKAQNIAIKTNLLYDATATANAGIELPISRQWTYELAGNYNAWDMSHDRKWKHWMLQQEARYWFCNRFIGHFVGFHTHGGEYNVGNLDNNYSLLGTDFSKLSDNRYQGWFIGAGLAYGYSWVLDKHWNLEASIGMGYSYTKFDVFPCGVCTTVIERGDHHYFGITKAAINLIYSF